MNAAKSSNVPIVFNTSQSCYILPRMPYYPNGSYFDYNTCPERYDNTTHKLVRYCCFNIIINVLENSNFKKIQDWLTYNSSSLLVLPAIFFNLLSLLVLSRFSRLSASATSTHFYMQCLCVFDTLTILSKFIHEVIVVRNTIRDTPFEFNSILCKFTHFSESVFAITSIYILIAMSFDKLICVALPLKVGSLLTPKKARFICAFIVAFALFYSSHHLVNAQVHIVVSAEVPVVTTSTLSTRKLTRVSSFVENNMTNITTSTSGGQQHAVSRRLVYECIDRWRHLADQMKVVDNIIRVFIPIFFLCVCNLSIAIVLAKARKNTLVMLSECSTDTQSNYHVNRGNKINFNSNKKVTVGDRKPGGEEILMKHLIPSSNNLNNNNDESSSVGSHSRRRNSSGLCFKTMFNHCRRKKFQQQQQNETSIHHRRAKQNSHYISVMLFAVCFGFVVLNLPFAVKTFIERKFREKNETLNYLYSNEHYYTAQVTKTDIINAVRYDFFVYITHFLLDLNYILNFFLYFLSGSRFRSQLYALIRCKGACNRNAYMHTNDFNAKMLQDRRSTTTCTRFQPAVKCPSNNAINKSVK